MIYFITNEPQHLEKYHKRLFDNIKVLEDTISAFGLFRTWIREKINIENIYVGFDVESNGLDAWVNSTILKTIGDNETQYIFHTPYCQFIKYFNVLKRYEIKLIGHNIKFDLKFLITEDKIYYKEVYDTMIVEQRIFMKSGLSVSLANLCIRYLDVYPEAMVKSIRDEFIGVDVKTFTLEPRHLYYAANDVSNLFPIKKKQEEHMERYGVYNLIHKIEFPMISIIAKAEVVGFKFNSKQWLEIYEENLKEKFEIECKLDIEVKKLRDDVWGDGKGGPLGDIPEKRIYMLGGKWDNKRRINPLTNLFNADGTTNATDLFGGVMSKKELTGVKKKVNLYPNNINYGSDTQIMEIFGRLEEPLLTKEEILVVPQFTKTQKIDKTYYSYQTNEPSLQSYLIQLPNTRMKAFIKSLLIHRSLSKATSTYGANFISHLNSITGNIHTSFRQCFTETGRMSSGGGRQEPDKPNFQNIPAKADYAIRMRNCFMAREGYSIGTHDLSGAELIIMCSLSQDMRLLELSKGDMHSYVAQNSWRRIYNYRAHKLKKQHDNLRYRYGIEYRDEPLIKELNKYIRLSKNFIISQIENKDVRTIFKNMLFGIIYGMYARKAGKTLNISKEEGQIIIDYIKSEFPDVFRMVEEAAAFALKHGYIILNNRTKSRAWFPSIIEAIKLGLDFSDYQTRKEHKSLSIRVRKEESEARNIKIQGTQADMIKECTVEIQKWIDDNNYTDIITILSWVHDEIIDEHPNFMNGKIQIDNINSNFCLHYTQSSEEILATTSFPEVKAQIMRDVCNKYLHNVTMDVEYDVEPYWTK